MPVYYNNKAIIPAPFIEIKRELQKTGDGTTVGVLYNLTVTGKLMSYKGSPDSTGSFWTSSGYPADEQIDSNSRLTSLLTKQAALKNLFNTDGYWFEIQPWDGASPTKCRPRILDISFPTEQWFEYMDYTITMQADEFYGTLGNDNEDNQYINKISNADESWTIELNEQPENATYPFSYRLTHNLSAVGKRFYDSNGNVLPAWQQAKNYILPRLGIDNTIIASTGVLNVPDAYNGYNHIRSENTDEFTGTYSVSESWILTHSPAMEELTIETLQSATDPFIHVNINGTIQGLDTRDNNMQLINSKYTNASGYWNTIQSQIYTRAQNYAGISLNINPWSTHVGQNPANGVITYGYEYDNRPINCTPGAKNESVTIIDNNPTDIFASIPVLGRQAGPVLQAINTISAKQRQINIEIIMPTAGTCGTYMSVFNNKPDVSSLIAAASGGLSFTQIFKDQDQENWNPRHGTYSRTVSWTYQ